MKVVHVLGQLGLLDNVRGRGGGLRLALDPAAISVAEVIRATEGEPCLVECFDRVHNTCRIHRVCMLRGVLAEASAAFYAVLAKYTLADLIDNRQALTRDLGLDA